MADQVVISNLALSRLGDEATVASIDPPEGSAQAEHCEQFFEVARDTLLSMHRWNFSTKRSTLAVQVEKIPGFAYAYAKPAEAIHVFEVLPGDVSSTGEYTIFERESTAALYTPQRKFIVETSAATDKELILTNEPDAIGICAYRVTDTNRFSPLFVDTLAWLLASYVAGPIYKGKTGVEMSQLMLGKAMQMLSFATIRDADQSYEDVQVPTPWIVGR